MKRHVRKSEKSELRKPAKRKRRNREWKMNPVTGLPVFITPANAKKIDENAVYKFLRES